MQTLLSGLLKEGKNRKKLYMIGIDAAPLWLLEEYSNEKSMAPFGKLLDLNQIGDMESTLPPLTGPSWPSIYTGLTPGEHGVPDFFVLKKDYVKDVAYYDSEANPPFWKGLAEEGHRCLVITPAMNVMLPKYRNVDMISGFPLKSRSNSKELDALMKKHGFFGEPDIETGLNDGSVSDAQASAAYVKSVRARSEIAKEMMVKNDYDFVYVCFTETDRMQHFSLNRNNRNEYIFPIYREIAQFVGWVEERIDREGGMMIIVSDHGAQPIYNKFLMNKWLIDNGYASLKTELLEELAQKDKKNGSAKYAVREFLIKTKLRKVYDKMPYKAKSLANRALSRTLGGVSAGDYTRLHIFDFDMKRTRAFAEVSNNPVTTIWINDSRFAEGHVGKLQKERLKKELIRKLKNVMSLEDDRMFIDAFDSSSYYGNTKKFIPPDIFVEAKKGYTIDIFNFSMSTNFMAPEHAKSGDHTRNGIFGFYSHSNRIDISNMDVTEVSAIVRDYFGSARKGSRLFKAKR